MKIYNDNKIFYSLRQGYCEPYADFVSVGLEIEHEKPDATSELWHDIKLLEISPRTECNKEVSYTFGSGYTISAGSEVGTEGASISIGTCYSYNDATCYSSNIIRVEDASLIGDGEDNCVFTNFQYLVNGTHNNSPHMRLSSMLNGNVLFCVRNGGMYTIDLFSNFGISMITSNGGTACKYNYKNLNGKELSSLITFIG